MLSAVLVSLFSCSNDVVDNESIVINNEVKTYLGSYMSRFFSTRAGISYSAHNYTKDFTLEYIRHIGLAFFDGMGDDTH